MLVVSNIAKRFGIEEPLFNGVSFTVNARERVGLIGPNGSGKSTLLKIVMGELQPDQGSILFTPPSLRIGYLAQGLTVDDNLTIREVLYPQLTALETAEVDVERLADAMATAHDDALESLMSAYGEALERLENLSRSVDVAKGETLLAAFELDNLVVQVGNLSGGQKTRLGLAALLLNAPQLLILDEPTNHLDVVALEWLEGWLQDFDGGALIVSHDRTFLDHAVNQIVAIQNHRARVYVGNYRDYVETVQSEQDKHWAVWRDQQTEIARMEQVVHHMMSKAARKENATKDSTQRRYAKKVAKRGKAQEKRLERYLASDERVDKPQQTWQLKLDFADLPATGQDVVFLEDAAIGYGDTPLLEHLNLSMRAGERVVVLGPNGHGKSTLLKTIIGALSPLAGSVRLGASIKVGYLAQEQDILDPTGTALATLQQASPMNQTEARSFLHFFLFTGDNPLRPIADLSYGERSRLMLALLVAQGSNLLVLDEPINHLDVPSREQFEQALSSFPGSVLAVVHDRYFVDKFATTVWHVREGELTVEIRDPMLA
ncbi:MAG: ABC-F family ATP-binding cassette domain-containing protein [Anaerolineales bacterium]|nr:ABC-F family ATP-binding cassette domain-containing protein [Anaerolineales bacterium]